MNLIQIQEQLKGLPIQALQSYMNGSNPQVPPYLAAGEIQRREGMAQRQQAQQGAAQGQQPSIKEQLEKSVGLMGLQAQRSQQGIQQLAEQAQGSPMPTTEQTPQPEEQPKPEVMMARGGIVNLPVRENMFREGGVVGYADGGATMSAAPGALEALMKKREELRKLGLDTTKIDQQIAAMQGESAPGAIPEMTSKGLYAAVMPGFMQEAKAPTPEETVAQYRPMEEAAGISALLDRYKKQEADYESTKQARPMNDLIRALSNAPAGPSGFAQGALQADEANRASDIAQAERMAALHSALAEKRYGAMTSGYEKGRTSAENLEQARTRARGDVFSNVLQGESNAAQRDAMLKQAEIYARSSGRSGGAGAGLAGLGLKEKESQRKAIQAEIAMIQKRIAAYGKFPNKDQQAVIAEDSERLDELQGLLAALQGGSATAKGTPPPGGVKAASGAQSGKDPLGIL